MGLGLALRWPGSRERKALLLLLLLSCLLLLLWPGQDREEQAGLLLGEMGQCGSQVLAMGKGQKVMLLLILLFLLIFLLMSQVVAYSLYGPPSPRYIEGVEGNLEALDTHLPGFRMRLYLDHRSVEAPTLDLLLSLAR